MIIYMQDLQVQQSDSNNNTEGVEYIKSSRGVNASGFTVEW